MGHEIDWTTAEFHQGDVTVRVVPQPTPEWEELFPRLAYSTTWVFGAIDLRDSVVRVSQVHERGLEWLVAHLNNTVQATDRSVEIWPATLEPVREQRFAPDEDADRRDRSLTERLRRLGDRSSSGSEAA